MKLLFVNSIGRLKKSHVLQLIRLWLVNSVGRLKKSRTFCKEYEKSLRCCGRVLSLLRNVVSEVSKWWTYGVWTEPTEVLDSGSSRGDLLAGA